MSCDYLRQALHLSHRSGSNAGCSHEITVVDNNSSDGSPEMVGEGVSRMSG
ncbi:MAG: hypothetical protein MZV63_35245 [Marinilabiliales bacterium]|nr:hypothetical protein [Marinilabiliales bacterium]